MTGASGRRSRFLLSGCIISGLFLIDDWFSLEHHPGLSGDAVSFPHYFILMTGEIEANVGINQAYFLSDANIAHHANLIFVGINQEFHPFDAASASLIIHFP